MGSPKFEIGGMSFPISKKTSFSFEVMPTRSGGTLVRHRGEAIVDVIQTPEFAKRGKKIRINLQRVLGRNKKIILQQDMVRIGDQIFKLASRTKVRSSSGKAPANQKAKPIATKQSRNK